MVQGATGVLCADCARLPRRAKGLATTPQILRGAGASLAVGLGAGLLLGWVHWVGLLAAILLGLAVGSAALAGSAQHRDISIQVIAAVMTVVGMAVAGALIVAARPGHPGFQQVIAVLSSPGFLVPLLVAIIAALARFRF
jgi:hypothetical protein